MALVYIIGRLGKDASIESTSGGTKLIRFSLVENDYKNGEEVSTWYDCTSFNSFIIDKQSKALKKGSLVNVTGNLNVRPTFGKDGKLYLNYDVLTNDVRIINTGNGKRDGSQATEQPVQTEQEEVTTGTMKPEPSKPSNTEVEETTPTRTYVDDSDESGDDELPF